MLPANRLGTMAFLSHSRSVNLPFPYDKGSGGTRAAGQKLRRYLPLVKTGASKPLTVVLMDTVPGLGKVDSVVFWGDRWIVATSKGLITTP